MGDEGHEGDEGCGSRGGGTKEEGDEGDEGDEGSQVNFPLCPCCLEAISETPSDPARLSADGLGWKPRRSVSFRLPVERQALRFGCFVFFWSTPPATLGGWTLLS